MAHYDIFRQDLAIKYPAYGHALWEPSPGELYPSVEIGDVGFIREGKFHRLFNALLPADHESHQNFGVPEHHKPLKVNIPRHIDTGALSPNNFCSSNVNVLSGGGVFAAGPDSEVVSFSCSKSGAILSLPVPARRQDTLARGDFGKWITKHISLWFAFTQRLGLGITRMEDIILVTGCHHARSWANIAFSEGREAGQVSFGVRVSGVSNVDWHFPLEDNRGVALNVGPSGQNLPEDQCIFVRGFRATRFLGILPRLRGAAGPSQIPDEDEPGSDVRLLSIPDNNNDPLHTLLEYIATQAPECDMALVHDDDLKCLDGSSLETLRPDAVMGHLQRSAPQIWHVQCSDSGTETSIVKVATLSDYSFGAPTSQRNNESTSFQGVAPEKHVEVAPVLLERADASDKGKDRWIPTHRMSSGRDMEVPRPSLGRGHSTTTATAGQTPLHLAAEVGNVETALSLLDNGADVSAQNKGGWTPLHTASHAGNVEVVRVILDRGADATAQNDYVATPLHKASEAGQAEVVCILLDRGADVASQNTFRSTPLHTASREGHVEVIRVLLESGADPTARDMYGTTPLHAASEAGHADAIRVLFESGADATVAAQNMFGWTPLHLASKAGHVDAIRVLVKHGADVEVQNKQGSTPLHVVSDAGLVEATHVLLDCGADVTARNIDKSTPLHLASKAGHVEVARILLRRGADVTAQDKNGWTPLHSASSWGHVQLAGILLEYGADATARNALGSTPLSLATSGGHVNVAHVLLQYGGDRVPTAT